MSVFRWTAPLFKRFRRYSRADLEFLAGYLRPTVPKGGVFADLGGGTGNLAVGLARALDARAVVVDVTPQMLRRVAADPRVSVQLASAEDLPFPAGHFDAVVCCDAFHHFRDQHAAAHEMARVVRPHGGVLVLEMEATGHARNWVMLERLLREPASFLAPEALESLMALHGILGTTNRHNGKSYAFLGRVVVPGATKAEAR